MCLSLPRNRKSKVEKATKTIVVYKLLRHNFTTPHYPTRYTRGEAKQVARFSTSPAFTPIFFTDTIPAQARDVDRGLHSYGNLKRAKLRFNSWTRIIVECKIPRGALFIRGTKGEMVSLKIKVGKAILGNADIVKKFNANIKRTKGCVRVNHY